MFFCHVRFKFCDTQFCCISHWGTTVVNMYRIWTLCCLQMASNIIGMHQLSLAQVITKNSSFQFMRLQGKKAKLDGIQLIDVHADDMTSPEELTKNLTQETELHSHSKKNKDLPSSQQKRKHQITYLAFKVSLIFSMCLQSIPLKYCQLMEALSKPSFSTYFKVFLLLYYLIAYVHWGIPSSDGIPYGLADFFFFFFLLLLLLLPPLNMAFSEAKHNEGNLVLTW